ncbi:MAG: hypothetical protein R2911_44955 [Caldilineaceae bacterium]
MTQRTFSAPPYIERRLDFWKSCLLFVLFTILLLSALFWRQLQPRTQTVLLVTPRALPTLRLESVPTLTPTSTSAVPNSAPLQQLGSGGVAVTAEAATAAARANTRAFDATATSLAQEIGATATATIVAAEMTGTATPAPAPSTPTASVPSTIPFAPTATSTSADIGGAAPSLGEPPAELSQALTLEASLIPLTLSYPPPNAALPALVVSHLEGTGAPGTLITINYIHCATCSGVFPDRRGSQNNPQLLMQTLGSVLADGRGRWQLPLAEPLPPGQYHLLLTQSRPDGVEIATTGTSFTILEETLGPLALSIPMITFPAPAALIDLSQFENQQLVFHGSALPGQRIQLYINGAFAGEALTDTAESWHIPVQQLLSPGSYIAHVFALDPNGNVVAESAPAAFVIMRQNRG